MKKNILLIGIVALFLSMLTSCDPINTPNLDSQKFNIVAYSNSLLGKSLEEIKNSAIAMNFKVEIGGDYLNLFAYNEGETEYYMRIFVEFNKKNYCYNVYAIRLNNNNEELYREWRNIMLPTANIPVALEKLSPDLSLAVFICSLHSRPEYNFIQVQYLTQDNSLWRYCFNPNLLVEEKYHDYIDSNMKKITYSELKEKIIADCKNYIIQSSKLTEKEFTNSYIDEYFYLMTNSETIMLSIDYFDNSLTYNIQKE